MNNEMQEYRSKHRDYLSSALIKVQNLGYDISTAIDNYCLSDICLKACDGYVRYITTEADYLVWNGFGNLSPLRESWGVTEVSFAVDVLIEFIWSGIRTDELIKSVKPSEFLKLSGHWRHLSIKQCCSKIAGHYGFAYTATE